MANAKEADLVLNIRRYVQFYENLGYAYIIRNNTIRQAVVRKDGSKGYIQNGKVGSPDLILCIAGQFVGVECKRKGNKQSDLQKSAQVAIEKAGGRYWLVDSLDTFRSKFDTVVEDVRAHV